MKELDLDKILDLQYDELVTVGLDTSDIDDSDEPLTLSLDVKIPPSDVIEKLDKKCILTYRNNDVDGMAMQIDLGKYAEHLLKYVKDWNGFKGSYSREKLFKFFLKFPSISADFASKCRDKFKKHENEVLQQAIIDEKN